MASLLQYATAATTTIKLLLRKLLEATQKSHDNIVAAVHNPYLPPQNKQTIELYKTNKLHNYNCSDQCPVITSRHKQSAIEIGTNSQHEMHKDSIEKARQAPCTVIKHKVHKARITIAS